MERVASGCVGKLGDFWWGDRVVSVPEAVASSERVSCLVMRATLEKREGRGMWAAARSVTRDGARSHHTPSDSNSIRRDRHGVPTAVVSSGSGSEETS